LNPGTAATSEVLEARRPGRLLRPADRLRRKALEVRRDILTMLDQSQSGHTGGPLSCAELGTALFFHELNLDPGDPAWPERDFWHFSIGHVTPVSYSLMAERGYFPLADLMSFRAFAGHRLLDQLCGIVDDNRKQIDGDTEDTCGVHPLADNWRAFRWNVLEVGGHDMAQLLHALRAAREHRGQPGVILAHAAMGKGVSFI
jgi:transketolase N-terminal domain/subunit